MQHEPVSDYVEKKPRTGVVKQEGPKIKHCQLDGKFLDL